MVMMFIFFLLAFDVWCFCDFVDENMDHLSICEHVFVSKLKVKLYETIKTYCITVKYTQKLNVLRANIQGYMTGSLPNQMLLREDSPACVLYVDMYSPCCRFHVSALMYFSEIWAVFYHFNIFVK